MKKYIFFLLIALIVSSRVMSDAILLDGLYYQFNDDTNTAIVVAGDNRYSGTIVIPTNVTYNEKQYNVTSIGDGAFKYCTGLTSVTIPNSIDSIGYWAFTNCTSLTQVNITDLAAWCNIIFDNADSNPLSIAKYLFLNGSVIIDLIIPNNVTSIGNYAFYHCYLRSVTFGENVTSIGYAAFSECTGLTSVTIPNSVTSIGWLAFQSCIWLTSVTIGNSVTSIGNYAFNGCTSLTSVSIGNNVTTIGDGAFSYCTSLPVFDNIRYADTYLIEAVDKSLSTYAIREGTKWIGTSAFKGCTGLTSFEIPNSVSGIGYEAFYNCTSLTSMTIPNSVTSIGNRAFSQCTGLTSVTIGNSVTSIGGSAFDGCSGLTSVTIPNSVTSIGYSPFGGCTNLTPVTILSDALVSKNYSGTTLNFKSIFGEQVQTYIIGESVTSIGSGAFNACTSLTSVTIGNSVTSIGDYAFRYCTGLTSVTIPNSVTSIGNNAFRDCSGLTSITCKAMTPPTCGSYAFKEVPKSIPLYVPFGSLDAYRNATGWKDFTNIKPIADNVDITTVEVVPDETSVNIAWPKISGAYTYELVIKDKSGKVVCTLVFDAEGRLLSIAFNAPARDNMPQQTQVAGFAFTVTSLNSGTTYNYSIASKDSNGNTLNTESGSFTTTGEGSGLQNVTHQPDETKFIRDGQLFIQRDGKTYSVTGQEVK